MKHLKKIFLLLTAGITAFSGAWAQTRAQAQAGESYVISNSQGASVIGGARYQWYRNGELIENATADAYTVPGYLAYGENEEFKRGVSAADNTCDEWKFSNTVTVRFCNLLVTGSTTGKTCWAKVNVNDPGQFAAKPDTLTKFYQWNKPGTAWPATGAISGTWPVAGDPDFAATTWINGSPCPAGWRLPTKDEYVALDAQGGDLSGKGGRWAVAGASVCGVNKDQSCGNKVAGRFYGKNFATCSLAPGGNMVGCVFFPAAGYRTYTNGALNSQGGQGNGWSSTQYNGTNGYFLYFNSTASGPAWSDSKAYGFPVRCVQ
ncbi:MAG: hypothetical protein LBK47_08735 [Prevotellaceae bacterium]|jgi:uncharacterized protein (TIGR02145 family)|nr:hypothetical protein [Prevotellaceae bacterium]